MTYGEHQARSAEALAWLLIHRPDVEPPDVPALLSCRRALLSAHRERCELTVRGAVARLERFKGRRVVRDLGGLAKGGAVALSVLLDEYPAFTVEAARFTDVLSSRHDSRQLHAWAEAARHAVLATAELADDPSWTREPEMGWLVTADVADTAQALTHLDRALVSSMKPVIPGWSTILGMPAAELAMAARHIGYVARSGTLDERVDEHARREFNRGVLAVYSADDLLPAMSHTARLLDSHALSIGGLRRFAIMHGEIAERSRQLAEEAGLDAGASVFGGRAQVFRHLAGATVRVSSIGRSQDLPALAQTQEAGRLLVRRRRQYAAFVPELLRDVTAGRAQVGEALERHIGRALAVGRFVVVDDGAVDLRWRRVMPREEPAILEVARDLTRLNHHARSTFSVDTTSSALSRQSAGERQRDRFAALVSRQAYPRRPQAPNSKPLRKL